MTMKNSNDNIGNRTSDLPGCSAVPQTTAPLRNWIKFEPRILEALYKCKLIEYDSNTGSIRCRASCLVSKVITLLLRIIGHAESVRNKVKTLYCRVLCKFLTVIGGVIDEVFCVEQQWNDPTTKKKSR